MLKSFRQPITLPAIVTSYFEPSSGNVLDFIGGNRASHQIYVAHQIRLLKTVLSAVKGKFGANPEDIALQNRALTDSDISHLNNIIKRLSDAELVDHVLAGKMNDV